MRPARRFVPFVSGWHTCAALALVCLLSACASTPSAIDSVNGIAERLVTAAELRADPARMQVCVGEIAQTMPERNLKNLKRAAQGTGDPTGIELEQMFVLALSRFVNVVELKRANGELARLDEAALRKVAEENEASHVLVGDYVVRDDEVVVSVRFVEVATGFIVAGAQGTVPLRSLSNQVQGQHGVEGRGIFGWFDLSSEAASLPAPPEDGEPERDATPWSASVAMALPPPRPPEELRPREPEPDRSPSEPPDSAGAIGSLVGAHPSVIRSPTVVLGDPIPVSELVQPGRSGTQESANAAEPTPAPELPPAPALPASPASPIGVSGPAAMRVLRVLQGEAP